MAASRWPGESGDDRLLEALCFTVPGTGDVAVRAGEQSLELGVRVVAIVQRGGMCLLVAEGGAAWLVPPSMVRWMRPTEATPPSAAPLWS